MKVYRYEVFDRRKRIWRLEPHYATAAVIEAARGLAIEDSAIEVDEASLVSAGTYPAEAGLPDN